MNRGSLPQRWTANHGPQKTSIPPKIPKALRLPGQRHYKSTFLWVRSGLRGEPGENSWAKGQAAQGGNGGKSEINRSTPARGPRGGSVPGHRATLRWVLLGWWQARAAPRYHSPSDGESALLVPCRTLRLCFQPRGGKGLGRWGLWSGKDEPHFNQNQVAGLRDACSSSHCQSPCVGTLAAGRKSSTAVHWRA